MANIKRSRTVAPGWFSGVKATATGESYPNIAIFDTDGSSHNMAWLESVWGMPLDIRRADVGDAAYVMRITELRFHEGPCVQIVATKGLGGEPLRCAVARWWPDAPNQFDPYPEDCVASRWHENAVKGWTEASTGVVGFGMGSGDMPGSSAVWAVHCEAPCDYVGNLGWLPMTNHKSIDVTFQVFEAGEEPTPPEPPETEGDYWMTVPISLTKR